MSVIIALLAGLMVFGILSRVVGMFVRLVATVIIIGMLYFAFTSGFFVDVVSRSLPVPTYDQATQTYSVKFSGYEIKGRVGSANIAIIKDNKKIAELTLPAPAELQDGQVVLSKGTAELLKSKLEG